MPVFRKRGTPEDFADAFSKTYSKYFKIKLQKNIKRVLHDKNDNLQKTPLAIAEQHVASTDIEDKSCISKPQFLLRK